MTTLSIQMGQSLFSPKLCHISINSITKLLCVPEFINVKTPSSPSECSEWRVRCYRTTVTGDHRSCAISVTRKGTFLKQVCCKCSHPKPCFVHTLIHQSCTGQSVMCHITFVTLFIQVLTETSKVENVLRKNQNRQHWEQWPWCM